MRPPAFPPPQPPYEAHTVSQDGAQRWPRARPAHPSPRSFPWGRTQRATRAPESHILSPPRPRHLSLLLLAALLLTGSAAACDDSAAPPKPLHIFRLEGLLAPDGSSVSMLAPDSSFEVTTQPNDRDTEVAVVTGPVVVTEGNRLFLSVSTEACENRKLCADYVLWMDGKPLARGAMTHAHQQAVFFVATDGTITLDSMLRHPEATLTPIDPAHPEQGRLELPDDVAALLAHGPPAKPAE